MRNLVQYPITFVEKIKVLGDLIDQLANDQPIPPLGIGDIRAVVLTEIREDLELYADVAAETRFYDD